MEQIRYGGRKADVKKKVTEKVSEKVTENQSKIINEMRKNPQITVTKLKEKKLVIRKDSDRSEH